MFWNDNVEDAIYMSDLSGANAETLVDTQLAFPGSSYVVAYYDSTHFGNLYIRCLFLYYIQLM